MLLMSLTSLYHSIGCIYFSMLCTICIIFSQVRSVYPVKYIFFTTSYTTGYGLLVAFVACWLFGIVAHGVTAPACARVAGSHPVWIILFSCYIWLSYLLLPSYLMCLMANHYLFTVCRNARIASAVLATAFPSVCPSVRLSHAAARST